MSTKYNFKDFIIAVKTGNLKIVKESLKENSKFLNKPYGVYERPAIIWAIAKKQIEVFKYLILDGANLYQDDLYGYNILCFLDEKEILENIIKINYFKKEQIDFAISYKLDSNKNLDKKERYILNLLNELRINNKEEYVNTELVISCVKCGKINSKSNENCNECGFYLHVEDELNRFIDSAEYLFEFLKKYYWLLKNYLYNLNSKFILFLFIILFMNIEDESEFFVSGYVTDHEDFFFSHTMWFGAVSGYIVWKILSILYYYLIVIILKINNKILNKQEFWIIKSIFSKNKKDLNLRGNPIKDYSPVKHVDIVLK